MGRVATEQKVGFSYVLASLEVRQLRPEELTQSLQRKSRQQCAKNGLLHVTALASLGQIPTFWERGVRTK